jgi:hypothetical protein
MFNIKKAKNFDGIRGVMSEQEFDSIMYCLEYAIEKFGELENENLMSCCKKAQYVLATMPYFDIENKQVHIQLGYSEIEIITTALYLFALPCGESENSFSKCIERPNAKIWTTKATEN